jgi:L-fuculose-phosphate aldolase
MSADARQQMVRYAHRLHAAGWVANHDGNLSARLRPGRFLCTPTAISKADVDLAGLVEVDDAGKRVAGGKPFGEIGLHMTLYRRRADAAAVIHAHPPQATALACSGVNLIERPFIAEAVVSLGVRIPLVPFAAPGPAACEALAGVAGEADVALLGNHGVIAWGTDLEQAYLRLELVEHLARIAIAAQAVGGVQALPEAAIRPLLEARAKAGLGANPGTPTPATAPAPAIPRVVACAPAPHAQVEVVAPGGPSEMARIIGEEIARVLARHRRD